MQRHRIRQRCRRGRGGYIAKPTSNNIFPTESFLLSGKLFYSSACLNLFFFSFLSPPSSFCIACTNIFSLSIYFPFCFRIRPARLSIRCLRAFTDTYMQHCSNVNMFSSRQYHSHRPKWIIVFALQSYWDAQSSTGTLCSQPLAVFKLTIMSKSAVHRQKGSIDSRYFAWNVCRSLFLAEQKYFEIVIDMQRR